MFEGSEKVSAEGSTNSNNCDLNKSCSKCNAESGGSNILHILGEETAEQFLEDCIVGKEHGDDDTDHQEDVGPQRLRTGLHELLIIQAKQKTGGEEGKQTSVEDLCNQDDVGSVR